jgi:hypothetical protein
MYSNFQSNLDAQTIKDYNNSFMVCEPEVMT